MKASGNTITRAPVAAASPIRRTALSTQAFVSKGPAPAWTTAALTVLADVTGPPASQVRDELRDIRPAIVAAVYVRDWDLRELLVRDILEAANIHAIHLADRRVVADAKSAHAAMTAEEMKILLRVEDVLRQLGFSRQQAEILGHCDGGPEARAPADRAIAAITALREVELGLEAHRTAMATAVVGLQNFFAYHRSVPDSTPGKKGQSGTRVLREPLR